MLSFSEIVLRLVVAIVLGTAAGVEREFHEQTAGMRTIALVTLGCALFTIVSAYGFLALLNIPHVTLDPTRVASYIEADIGFLGAGTIFISRERERIRGLTTAATIWVTAAIGIACGTGMLAEAILTTALVPKVSQFRHRGGWVSFGQHCHYLQLREKALHGSAIMQ